MNMNLPRGSRKVRIWRALTSFTIAALERDPAGRDFDCCPRSVCGIATVKKKERISTRGSLRGRTATKGSFSG